MWDISAYELSILAAKSAIVLIVLLGAYRLLGKRDVSQFNIYDLVTIMALANSVQNAMTAGRGQLLVGIVSSGSLLLVAFFLTRIFVRLPGAQRLVLGVPVLLLLDGQILKDKLRSERITRDEFMIALREYGIVDPRQVAMAVLEIDGSISVVPKGQSTRVETKLV